MKFMVWLPLLIVLVLGTGSAVTAQLLGRDTAAPSAAAPRTEVTAAKTAPKRRLPRAGRAGETSASPGPLAGDTTSSGPGTTAGQTPPESSPPAARVSAPKPTPGASRGRRAGRPVTSGSATEQSGSTDSARRDAFRPASAPERSAGTASARAPEVLVTSESVTHRVRIAPNGVVVVEFPLADAIYAIHPGNQNIIEVDIDRDSRPNDPVVFRPGPSFDPLLRTQTVHSLQFVSGLFVTLIFEPTTRIDENDHRVILQYDIASIRAARARKGLATNLLRRPTSPLMDEDPRVQTMPSVLPLSPSTNLEPPLSADTSGSASGSVSSPVAVAPPSGASPSGDGAAVMTSAPSSSSPVTGPATGQVTGSVTGQVTGPVTGQVTEQVTGPATGQVTGLATGPVTGPATGPVTGLVTDPAATGKTPAEEPSTSPPGQVTPVPVPGKNIALGGSAPPVSSPSVPPTSAAVGVIAGETGALVLPSAVNTGSSSRPERKTKGRSEDRSERGDRKPSVAPDETPLPELDDLPTPVVRLISGETSSRPVRDEQGTAPAPVTALPGRHMTLAEREKYRLVTEYYQTLGISIATVHRIQLDLEEKVSAHRQRRSVDWLALLDVQTARKNFPRWPVLVSFVEILDDADFPGIRRYILGITVHHTAERPLYIASLDPDIFIVTRNERTVVNTERLIPLATLAASPSTVIRPGETAYFGIAIPRPTLSDNQILEIGFIDAEKANRPILAREFRLKKP